MTDWDQILREHGRLVWQRVYRLLGHHADASDCFQEVFVSALDVARREQVNNWPGLLLRLATARALDRLRQRIRRSDRYQEPDESFEAPGDDPTPLEHAESAELANRLREALVQLPPQQAEAFSRRFFDDLSYDQIAAGMGISPNAAGVLIHRARTRLAKLLQEQQCPPKISKIC
mgnify:CR=1 FL=1